jgi:regulator of replication initiation timing
MDRSNQAGKNKKRKTFPAAAGLSENLIKMGSELEELKKTVASLQKEVVRLSGEEVSCLVIHFSA